MICYSLKGYLRKVPKYLFPWKASQRVLVNAHTVGLYIRVLPTQELWENPTLWWEWRITRWRVCQPRRRTFLRAQVCSLKTAQGPATLFSGKQLSHKQHLSCCELFHPQHSDKFPRKRLSILPSSFVSIRPCATVWFAEMSLTVESLWCVSSLSREGRCRMWWNAGTAEKMQGFHCENYYYWPSNVTRSHIQPVVVF